MTMNLRPVSFAILSGALMIVGSSMAFANPDQTNPRESSLSTPCAAADAAACEAVSQAAPVSQDVTVTPDASASDAASNQSYVVSDHDARKNRNRAHSH